jgi:hypothetical protein
MASGIGPGGCSSAKPAHWSNPFSLPWPFSLGVPGGCGLPVLKASRLKLSLPFSSSGVDSFGFPSVKAGSRLHGSSMAQICFSRICYAAGHFSFCETIQKKERDSKKLNKTATLTGRSTYSEHIGTPDKTQSWDNLPRLIFG